MKLAYFPLILIAGFLLSCERKDDTEENIRRVIIQKPLVASEMMTRYFAGQARTKETAKLSFRVPGTVNYLDQKVGDYVKQGDILATIDSVDYSLQMQETEASLLKTKAESRHADADYARVRDLYETKSTSLNELDAARAGSESAMATVNAMQKRLALARNQINHTSLLAPSDGQIASVFVEKNENVQKGQPIITLNSISNLEILVYIPENIIALVKNGDKVTAIFDALPGKVINGTVSEVGVESGAGNIFPVIVELLDSPKGILSGMAVEVIFRFHNFESAGSLFVKASSVISKGRETSVFVVKSVDKEIAFVEKKRVTTGKLTNEGIEILSGLDKNEYVVIAGTNSIVDGQKVKIKE